METNHEIKETVKEKYGQIARGEVSGCAPNSSCCGGGADNAVVNMALKYDDADRAALPEGADLGLGCGTPAAFAELREGMTVLDLGSGGGIDCFIAAQHVGPSGLVIGVDMTEDMIARANANKAKVAVPNVEFRLGDIESLPVQSGTVDRVLSNCVINLVPDKAVAFAEVFRVLKPGGGFTISDIVVNGVISPEERKDASLWAGCISGALDRSEYLSIVERAGFEHVRVVTEKRYDYKLQSDAGLYSITVSATKP
ncbi:MAG TPA: arsenite methyltransferase [Bacteroidota bacterium]|nr:arsenite methyltransferase [Bacteroidota bacterium]